MRNWTATISVAFIAACSGGDENSTDNGATTNMVASNSENNVTTNNATNNVATNNGTANSSTNSATNATVDTSGASQEPHDGEPRGSMTFTIDGAEEREYTLYAGNTRQLGERWVISAYNNPPDDPLGGVINVSVNPTSGPGMYACVDDPTNNQVTMSESIDGTSRLLDSANGGCQINVTNVDGSSIAGTFTATVAGGGLTRELTSGAFSGDL